MKAGTFRPGKKWAKGLAVFIAELHWRRTTRWRLTTRPGCAPVDQSRIRVRDHAKTGPDFAETWFAESFTFPTGRGQEKPLRGWVCSGCGRGYAPAVRECAHCPETQPAFIAKADVPDDPDYER